MYAVPMWIAGYLSTMRKPLKFCQKRCKLLTEMQGKAIVKFADVWKNGEAAINFPIQAIPFASVHKI